MCFEAFINWSHLWFYKSVSSWFWHQYCHFYVSTHTGYVVNIASDLHTGYVVNIASDLHTGYVVNIASDFRISLIFQLL